MASPLGRLFGKSPIAPIQQHMQLAQEAVQLLCELLTAAADGNRERAGEIQTLLRTTIGEARRLRHDIRTHLPRGLLLAMPRADLLHLVEIQQDILARVMALGSPLAARGLHLDGPVREAADLLSSHIADAADKALAAIRELDEMLEVAFSGHEHGPVHEALDALREQMDACDVQGQRLITEIVAAEASLPPVDAALLYRTADDLAQLAQRCSDVGDQLDLLLAR
jgi:predicted phosphate transport protein (TIGR00153 family)